MNNKRPVQSSRRNLIKTAAIGGVATAGAASQQWVKPVVNSVMLPAHAQTSVVEASGGGAAPVPFGPIFPPPGGVNFAAGGGAAADAGGAVFNFTNFDPTAYDTLFWGPAAVDSVQAGLSGVLDNLVFDSIAGAVATWTGTTAWTDPGPGGVLNPAVPVCFSLTLNAGTWTADPIVGAVFEIVGGADFSVTLQFFADEDGGGCDNPLNGVLQGGAGLTVSSFAGGFTGTA